jgi:hypothetical protein
MVRNSVSMVLVAVLAFAGACGGSSKKASPVPEPTDPAAERKSRLESVNKWIDTMWSDYVNGRLEPYVKTLGKDLFTWGTSAGVTIGYDAAVKEAKSDFANWKKLAERKVTIGYHEVSRRVGLSADNKKAWVITEKEVIVRYPQGTSHMALVMTALLVDRGGVWKKVHSHSGTRVPLFAIRASAKRGPLPKPKAFDSQVGEGAQPLVDLFRGRIGNFASLGEIVASGDDVQFGFGMMGTYVTGSKRVGKVLEELAKGGPKLVPGDVRAQLVAPDVGWVSANLVATFSDFSAPFRVSAVFQKEDAGWRVVQLHLSFAHGEQPPLTLGARTHPCADESNLRSTAGKEATLVRFRNASREPMKLHWLDENGARKKAVTLEPGAESLHRSWPTFVYVLTDMKGACKVIYQPRKSISAAVWTGK